MNQRQRFDVKAKRAVLRRMNAKYGPVMEPVPEPEWPSAASLDRTQIPMGVWRSRDFLAVQFLEPGKYATRLSVNRTALLDSGLWQDGITWDELQRVKSECGFGDLDAVEIYPRDTDVVNVSNMRHLWLMPVPISLTWRSEARREVTQMAEQETTDDTLPEGSAVPESGDDHGKVETATEKTEEVTQ